jgi:hypothetical protein
MLKEHRYVNNAISGNAGKRSKNAQDVERNGQEILSALPQPGMDYCPRSGYTTS